MGLTVLDDHELCEKEMLGQCRAFSKAMDDQIHRAGIMLQQISELKTKVRLYRSQHDPECNCEACDESD